MPVLGVCGDSYWGATLNDGGHWPAEHLIDSEGKHFTELLAKAIGYEYFTLARAGCSNSVIRLQIEAMIDKKVDFVIFGNTTEHRIEIPLTTFHRSLGIQNISYERYPNQSKKHITKKPTTISENLLTLEQGHRDINEFQLESIKSYIKDLYDFEYRRHQDTWLLASGVQALKDAKIPYLFLPGWEWINRDRYFAEPNIRISFDRELHPQSYDVKPHNNRLWHTSDEAQVTLFNKVLNYINTHKLLEWN